MRSKAFPVPSANPRTVLLSATARLARRNAGRPAAPAANPTAPIANPPAVFTTICANPCEAPFAVCNAKTKKTAVVA